MCHVNSHSRRRWSSNEWHVVVFIIYYFIDYKHFVCLFYQWFCAWYICLRMSSDCAPPALSPQRACLSFHVVVQNIVILLHRTLVCSTKLLAILMKDYRISSKRMRFVGGWKSFSVWKWMIYDIIDSWIICSTSFPSFSSSIHYQMCVDFSLIIQEYLFINTLRKCY